MKRVLGLFSLATLGLLVLTAPPSAAQILTRGPYLQSGSHSNLVIRWRTDLATDSRVAFGTNLANLEFAVSDSTTTTEHELALPGLLADTSYFYAVGSTTNLLAGNDSAHCFRTAPPPHLTKPTRVWVIGDAGTKIAGQIAVRDAYAAFTGARPTDLWLMLGDNAYLYGTDQDYQLAVFNIYTNLLRSSVLWPTLGNHDTYSVEATGNHAYFDLFTLPTNGLAGGVASGTESYYSFNYGRIHFICLDSTESSRDRSGPMATWLTNDLANSTADWIIAFWHHAPYTHGAHNSDTEIELVQMRTNIVPLLEAGGVDLVLSGHSHSYERSYLISGHYGTSDTFSSYYQLNRGDGRESGGGAYHKPRGRPAPHYGTVYAVVGSSGWTSGGPLDYPAMRVSLNQLGSLVLDLTSNRLDALFLSETGATNDSFTLLKIHDPPVASNLVTTVTGDQAANLTVTGSDPDQNPISFQTDTLPAQGLVTELNPTNGTLTYVPAHGRAGPDTFTFRTHNGYLRSLPATVSVNVLAPMDTNANGLPDYWETRYGLTDPTSDSDSDGLNNRQEYLANTNPTNAASTLRITGAFINADGYFTLAWAAVGGTRYRVSFCDTDPGGVFTDILLPAANEINPAPIGLAAQQSFTDDFRVTPGPPPEGQRFYRVRVAE